MAVVLYIPGEGLHPLGPVVHLGVDVGQLTLQPLYSGLTFNISSEKFHIMRRCK